MFATASWIRRVNEYLPQWRLTAERLYLLFPGILPDMEMPWPKTAPIPSPAHTSLRRLSASIAVANGLAASGRAIDLGGLEAVTGLLCAQVLDLEPAEGSAIRPAIVTLNSNIGSLIETLKITGR